jgi:hypothetical protein
VINIPSLFHLTADQASALPAVIFASSFLVAAGVLFASLIFFIWQEHGEKRRAGKTE